MKFDLESVPFSRYGSYLGFSYLKTKTKGKRVFLRSVRGDSWPRESFLVDPISNGKRVPFKIIAEPGCLTLKTRTGQVDICFESTRVLRVRCRRVGVRFTMWTIGMFGNALPVEEGAWLLNSWDTRQQFMLTRLAGDVSVDAPMAIAHSKKVMAEIKPSDGKQFAECAIEEFRTSCKPVRRHKSFDRCVADVNAEFERWTKTVPPATAGLAEARALASYICWSSVVEPSGLFKRPAMLMSKNWMINVWSWDHCFNALAFAQRNPEFAWDQLMVMFDHQAEDGVLPDSINDVTPVWNFCKPPIHGWTLRRMMEKTKVIGRKKLAEIYGPLARWTRWWMDCRDYDGDGIPQYNHGNDSGWDNGTPFDKGYPLEGPDLSAFLVIQMEVLGDSARKLGRHAESRMWRRESAQLLRRLLKHSWRGDRFIAPRSGIHDHVKSDSLLVFLPIILGKRLPAEVLSTLVAGLRERGRFLTQHGLATESTRSERYMPDGYWRGPIWAPSTMLIVDGLKEAGEHALARTISEHFCRMVARSGCAENFDALTGQGLRDRAYTWTASVFMLLAEDLLER